MLPRVKLYLAIAIGLFVFSLLFTGVRIPATVVSASAASPRPLASPLIAFHPFAVGTNIGANSAYIYQAGLDRYQINGNVLTGRAEASGEKIVFVKGLKLQQASGQPPATSSAPLYLSMKSPNKPCWRFNSSNVTSIISDSKTSIASQSMQLVVSSSLPVCKP